jgi:hypothetical protein
VAASAEPSVPATLSGRDGESQQSEPLAALEPRDVVLGSACAGAPSACMPPDLLVQCLDGAWSEGARCFGVCRWQDGAARCAGECKPGGVRCSADGLPERCDDDGRFQAGAPCSGETPACVEGACAACVPTMRRCSTAGVPEVCTADGSGYVVHAVCAGGAPLCIPETGECGECSEGSARPCTGAFGNCAGGQQLCAQGRWGACSITPQVADGCSTGDDADCDGTPNEGCACSGNTACGPPASVGLCVVGTSACVNGQTEACVDAVLPASRNCTSPFDNDCDGRADNTPDGVCQCTPGASEACNTHPGLDGIGICRAGTRSCVAAAGNLRSAFGACVGSLGPRPRDCRTAQDNDCNGLPDNTLDEACACRPGERRACGELPGSFGCATGTQVCEASADGSRAAWSSCSFAAVRDGSVCDDSLPLTIGEACAAGRCNGPNIGSLAVGAVSSCALRSGGAVFCWGSSTWEESVRSALTPTRVPLAGPTAHFSLGNLHGCAVSTSDQLECWGIGQDCSPAILDSL